MPKKDQYIHIYFNEEGKAVIDVNGEPKDLLSLLVTAMQYPEINELIRVAVDAKDISLEATDRVLEGVHIS